MSQDLLEAAESLEACYLLTVTILISVIAIVLESIPELSRRYQAAFEWIQLVSTMILRWNTRREFGQLSTENR